MTPIRNDLLTGANDNAVIRIVGGPGARSDDLHPCSISCTISDLANNGRGMAICQDSNHWNRFFKLLIWPCLGVAGATSPAVSMSVSDLSIGFTSDRVLIVPLYGVHAREDFNHDIVDSLIQNQSVQVFVLTGADSTDRP